jgi:hypothetical protein
MAICVCAEILSVLYHWQWQYFLAYLAGGVGGVLFNDAVK